MKKIAALCAFAFVLASSLFAGETHRYVVATRSLVPAARAISIVRAAADNADATPAPERDVVAFHNFRAFAANLTDEEAAALRQAPEVNYVEPVAERHLLDTGEVTTNADASNPFAQVVPFGIDLVHARDVWPVTRGQGINVVVVDTGIDYTHPELQAVYAGGYNTYDKSNSPLDDNGHGTHVSGTIAAADNNVGVVGVAPNVRLWVVKVLNASGSGTTDKILAALDWVLDKKNTLGGNWVLNFSLGSSTPNSAERDAFGRAVDAGLVICAASGNESTATLPAAVGYPAAYRDILAIGAVDASRNIATFSNQGPQLAVVAPGVSVLSTVRVGSGQVATVQANSGNIVASALELSKQGTVTAEFVSCGIGNPTDFPASVAGRIAVIQRGTLTFNEKAHNAVNAGAIGVIIYNNDPVSAMNWTLKNDKDPGAGSFNWPVTIGISQADGQALLANAKGKITITARADDYDVYSGTSMATPHAVGVTALVWSAAPQLSAQAIRLAIENNADDLGAAGFDTAYGFGLADAFKAAKAVAPAKFGSPTTTEPPPPAPGKAHAVRHH